MINFNTEPFLNKRDGENIFRIIFIMPLRNYFELIVN